MKKLLFIFCVAIIVFCSFMPVNSATAQGKGKILFIPHDNRPISGKEPAKALSMLGYEVVIAPEELLGRASIHGNAEKLAEWAKKNIRGAMAAVISSDAMIYGGLVASRNHELSMEELEKRVKNIILLKEENPTLNIYVYASVMRTPKGPEYSGNEEPEYYKHYGREIFQATELIDKKDIQSLSSEEDKQLNELMNKIPNDVWQDWSNRRKKNFEVNKKLIDLTRTGTLEYFILGKDDTAPFSATHMEARILTDYSCDIPKEKFQLLAGTDELAMLLLARAVNEHEKLTPKIKVIYNIGKGEDTIPAFSDEPIKNSIDTQITIASGKQIFSDSEADFILLVNTNPDGRTGDGNSLADMTAFSDKPRPGTKEFANLVEKTISCHPKVAVADIAFANGADNALMKELNKRSLLMKLYAYAGWNTPTNSTGFVIGQGMLATRLNKKDYERLLIERYLDDYAYQTNIREKIIILLINKSGNPALCFNLAEYEEEMTQVATNMMREFALTHLPTYKGLDQLEFSFPWHRTFEGKFVLPE